jgi:hypothetical protein
LHRFFLSAQILITVRLSLTNHLRADTKTVSVMISSMMISRTVLRFGAGIGAIIAFSVAVGIYKTCAVSFVAISALFSVGGSVSVRAIVFASHMVWIGANLALTVVQDAAIFVVASPALCCHMRFVSAHIRKAERGCAKFQILFRVIGVLLFFTA